MDLRNLTDAELLESTDNAVHRERVALTTVLHHLLEVDRRRLYSSLKCASLIEFAMKRWKYTEDEAQRRISAMKTLRELPEIEEKISQGDLTLTHISVARSHFRQEKKVQDRALTPKEKLSVFEQIASKSTREAQRITFSLSSAPEIAKPDRVKTVSTKHVEFKFMAKYEAQEKANRLRGWLAHQHPDMSMGELFDKLCDLGLSEWNPAKTAAPRKRRVKAEKQSKVDCKTIASADPQLTAQMTIDLQNEVAAVGKTDANPIEASGAKSDVKPNDLPTNKPKTQTQAKAGHQTEGKVRQPVEIQIEFGLDVSEDIPTELRFEEEREISPAIDLRTKLKSPASITPSAPIARIKSKAQIRREVFARANGQCENCLSSYALEIDHIQPQALGGPSTPDNLRVLCRSCNQRAAIKALGLGKMERYLN